MDTLFLHPDSQGQVTAWGREAGAIQVLGNHSFADLADRYAGARVVIFAPSSQCLLTKVTVSARQRRQAIDALGWLIEEQVGEDAENLHVIAGPEQADGYTPLLAMSLELVEYWRTACREAGWALHALLPDVMLLPHADGAWSMTRWADGTVALRTGMMAGAVLDSVPAVLMLDAAMSETPDSGRPVSLRVSGMAESDQVAVQAWADAQGLPVEFSGTHDESELLLSVMDWARHPANLLQGRFASRQQVLVPPALRIAAIFLLVAFSVQLVSEWARYAYYSNQAEKSQAAAITLYKKLFPNERRIVSVRKQMEAHLSEGSGGDGGLPVLTKIAEAVQGSGLVAQRVDFSSGVLTLDIEARGLTEIDALKQKLQDVGLQAEIVSANAQNGAIRGRLRVETGA